MKKKWLSNILLVMIFLVGFSLLLYPTFSDWWNSMHQSRVVAAYDDTIREIDTSLIDQKLEDANAFNQRLNEASNKAEFVHQNNDLYNEMLDVGIGSIGYVRIPSIKVSLPIYHGTSQEVLQVGVGHVDWTSLPIGGEGTHTVLSGHSGLPSADLFTDLDAVKIGDRFSISVLNTVLYYEVDQIEIVLPEETNTLLPIAGQDYATLVTCTPYGVNTHRLLVRGHRITVNENKLGEIVQDAVRITPVLIGGMMLMCLWTMILIKQICKRIRKKRKSDNHGKE